MDMIAAVWAFKHSGNEEILYGHTGTADGAPSWQMMLKAAYTAPDIHQPVPSAGNGWICRRFYQIPFEHFN
jgi:hypothetical protein